VIYYSWKSTIDSREVIDCTDGVEIFSFAVHPELDEWHPQHEYNPGKDHCSVRVPDLYLTLKGVPFYEHQ